MTTTRRKIRPFALGEVVATKKGALAAIQEAGQPPLLFILRHLSGEWGEVCGDDWALNDEAVEGGDRLLSAYRTSLGERIWVITESDRNGTYLRHRLGETPRPTNLRKYLMGRANRPR